MELEIKQLKLGTKIFVPLTTAEAVLVKLGTTVITLDTLLKNKIDEISTPAGSGLNAIKSGTSVTIIHTNSISPNESASPVKIKYDNRGHIVETLPLGSLIVSVDGETYTLHTGELDSSISLGDDFGIENNNINLKWNNL